MISRLFSAAIIGIDSSIVKIEADIRRGLNKIYIVGLPDKAISEAKERIASAIKNSGYSLPHGVITVNLAPANIPKSGSLYDLPIALGILCASNQIKVEAKNKLFIGELSLDGQVRRVNGALSILTSPNEEQIQEFFIPDENKYEVGFLENRTIYPVKSLVEVINHLNGEKIHKFYEKSERNINTKYEYDLKNVVGQEHAKRALEIAAAGGHNIMFNGVPGSGKTYISRCMPSILPQMEESEIIDVTKIYSVSGLTKDRQIIVERPFRSPHSTSSEVAIIGGGAIPHPGEVTLAHRGVLFLDEFSEFPQKTLEALRQPLEDRVVSISRASGTINFPANFILIAAMNPCKCGYYGDPDKECICSASEVVKYNKRISGPIVDRIDLQIRVPKVKVDKLARSRQSEESNAVRKRVESARKIQKLRHVNNGIYTNSQMNFEMIRNHIHLSKESLTLLKSAVDSLNLSARSYFRILKVSRTIADLEASDSVKSEHVAEALSYRF